MKQDYSHYVQRLMSFLCLMVAWTCLRAQTTVTYTDDQGNKVTYTISGDSAMVSNVSYGVITNGVAEVVIRDDVDYNSVVYPVTAIKSRTFYGDNYLGKVTIGDNVRYIEDGAFYYCRHLKEVLMGASVVKLGDNAFYYCEALQTMELPGVRDIGQATFANCYALEEASMPDVENLGYRAFYACKKLQNIKLSDKLGSIPTECFFSCDSLRSVTGGANVKTINARAFYDCISLQLFDFQDKVQIIQDEAFWNCKLLSSITGLSAIATIGQYAFYGCSALDVHLELPALESLAHDAFSGCSKLRSATLGDALTVLPSYAFYNCSGMEWIHLSANLQTVDYYPFTGSSTLKRVSFPGSAKPTFTTSSLGLPDYVTLYVQENLIDDYRGDSYVNRYRLSAYGITENYTAIVKEGGTLRTAISNAGLKPAYLTSLTVKGPINGTDIDFLHGQMPLLQELDLNEATIEAGGDSYHKWWVANDGTATKESSEAYNTEDNVVGEYMFYNMPMLRKLVLPQNTVKIGDYAVYMCRALADVDPFPATVKNIGNYAFYIDSYYGARFSNITFGDSLESIGEYAFYNSALKQVVIPSKVGTIASYSFANSDGVERIQLPNELRSIGYNAFYSCDNLKTVNLPDSLTELGSGAFSNAYKLESITIPSKLKLISNNAFKNCTSLKNVTFQKGLETIGDAAFSGCNVLDNIALPDGLKSIGYNAFYSCDNLKTVNLPNSLTELGSGAFSNAPKLESITIPAKLKLISNNAFNSCTGLKEVIFQEGLETIDYDAFYNCTVLDNVVLPEGLNSIGSSAFSYCYALKNITFPKSLTNLGSSAFMYSGFREITMPENVTSLPYNLFYQCDSLHTVHLAQGTIRIGDYCFYACKSLKNIDLNLPSLVSIGNEAFSGCSSMKEVVLSNSITSLGSGVFSSCTSLQSPTLPSGIVSLPSSTFRDCSSLVNVVIPESVKSIGNSAFRGCTSLTELDIPKGMSTIYDYAFDGCSNLLLSELPDGLTYIGSYAFQNCKSITVSSVPATVTNLNRAAFYGCTNITSMDLSAMKSLTEVPERFLRAASGLRSVKLPSSLTSIGYEAFYECSSLDSIILPESLRVINRYAFYNCSALRSIALPSSLTKIDYYAFRYAGLREIDVPDNVTEIGNMAFANNDSLRIARLGKAVEYTGYFNYFQDCDSLDILRIYAGNVPSARTNEMKYRTRCVLEVPMGSEEVYRSASVWNEFKEIRGFVTGDKLAAQDFAVMKELYDHLGGAEWINTWDLTTDDRYPGKWYGVVTEGDHIKEINISGNGQKGTIPVSVFNLPNLTSLNLSIGNIEMLVDTLMKEPVETSVLTELNLSSNRLKGDVTMFLSKLPALKNANLNSNMLTEVSAPLDNSMLTELNIDFQFAKSDGFVHDTILMPVDTLVMGLDNVLHFNTLQRYYHYYQDYSMLRSLYGMNFTGTKYTYTRALFNVTSLEDGDYQVTPRTANIIKLVNNAVQYFTPNTSIIRPKPIYIMYKEGDINIDYLVDATDLALLVQYFVNADKPSNVAFNYSAADGEDNDTLDVRDIVMTVNCILDAEPDVEAMARRMYAQGMGQNSDMTVNIEQDGRMFVNTSHDNVTAMQFDLRGCDAGNVRLASGVKGFTLAKKEKEDGTVRVLVYSASGKTLKSGVTMLLHGLGSGAFVVDAVVADTDAQRLKVNFDDGETGIKENVNQETKEDVYDLSGRKHQKVSKGVFVVNGKKIVR